MHDMIGLLDRAGYIFARSSIPTTLFEDNVIGLDGIENAERCIRVLEIYHDANLSGVQCSSIFLFSAKGDAHPLPHCGDPLPFSNVVMIKRPLVCVGRSWSESFDARCNASVSDLELCEGKWDKVVRFRYETRLRH